MAERERALQALAGRYFPHVGDVAEIRRVGVRELTATVMVTRMSADGEMITVRVLGRDGPRLFGAQRSLSRQAGDGAGLYSDTEPGARRWCFLMSSSP